MGFIETSYGSNPNLSQVNIDSDLNMQNYDIINVKRFLCQDYMGALLAVASDNLQDTVILNDIANSRTKLFRVPSNFVAGSTIKLGVYVITNLTIPLNIQKYDPLTEIYTTISTLSITSTGGVYKWVTTNGFAVNAGDLLTLQSGHNNFIIKGSEGVKINYDPNAVSGAVWEVEE